MSSEPEEIGIVGTGHFGLALASLLGHAGRRTLLWSPDDESAWDIVNNRRGACMPDLELPMQVRVTTDPGEFGKSTRFVVVTSSAQEVREHLSMLGGSLHGNHIAVHAVGAFCSPDNVRVSEVIAQETPVLRSGVLAGPSMAEFIVAGRGTSLVCASEFKEVTAECGRLLAVPPKIRLYRSNDLIGAELASALSMAYTISVGLADAIEVGIGIRAVLITRAVAEMARLGEASGAQAKTFWGLAGLGNLLVRTSEEDGQRSPSYQLGQSLAAGGKSDPSSESHQATVTAIALAQKFGLRLPVLATTGRVLSGEISANQAATELLAVMTEEE